ncbi:MAG: enoyl-CoA hydratase/isomerase family protein [Sphingomonadales bacterium]|jgi:enoyl-CoA hydratase/carnithine racemase|nr:enoyl-CoA hydratase/isomerase family protein [Sphingomonadales bacterium]MBK9004210.1 enoyl-CoA hydratase/isomerase family protein [Sphingomonadales bacterium]MBK9269387.1 enoyl-CoA hydratase/isomerase family protein [Sphingomonadales bacterium]
MSDEILLDTGDGTIWTVTLNRPQAMNAITMSMAAQLQKILSDAATDANARCLIVTGAGQEAFSAGFDIKEMAGFDNEAMRDAFVQRDPLFKTIALHPLPVISAINGKAFGAGALMAAASDFRIASTNAEFKVTAVNYGSANATWSLPAIVGPTVAKHILMTGKTVTASEGLSYGLFDQLVEPQELPDCTLKLAASIAEKPRDAIEAIKALVGKSLYSGVAEAWQAEHDHLLSQLGRERKGGGDVFEKFLSNGKSGRR